MCDDSGCAVFQYISEDLSPAFFPSASDMWTTHPALAYSAAAAAAAAAAAELQGQG